MEYDIKITQAELSVLYQGLGELPLKISQNVFAKIFKQIEKQDADKAIECNTL